MKIKYLILLIVSAVSLSACKSIQPIDSLVDNQVKIIEETIDFAENNMSNDPDARLLINSLKTCKNGLEDAKFVCKAELATCKAETDYWRLATFGLVLLIVGAIIAKFRGKL